jgi:hypothetical protein
MRVSSLVSSFFFVMFLLYNTVNAQLTTDDACKLIRAAPECVGAPKSNADCSNTVTKCLPADLTANPPRYCNQCVLNCDNALCSAPNCQGDQRCIFSKDTECQKSGKSFSAANIELGNCCDTCEIKIANCDGARCAKIDNSVCESQGGIWQDADPTNGVCCNTCDCSRTLCAVPDCPDGELETLVGHCCPSCKCPEINPGVNGELVTSPGEPCPHRCAKPTCTLGGRPQYDPISRCNKCICHQADCPKQPKCNADDEVVTSPNECCAHCCKIKSCPEGQKATYNAATRCNDKCTKNTKQKNYKDL